MRHLIVNHETAPSILRLRIWFKSSSDDQTPRKKGNLLRDSRSTNIQSILHVSRGRDDVTYESGIQFCFPLSVQSAKTISIYEI